MQDLAKDPLTPPYLHAAAMNSGPDFESSLITRHDMVRENKAVKKQMSAPGLLFSWREVICCRVRFYTQAENACYLIKVGVRGPVLHLQSLGKEGIFTAQQEHFALSLRESPPT